MELFFDLVFVVAVSQLAHGLLHRLTGEAVLEFLLLFIPVWWAWIGSTYYTDRFGTDDLSERLFLLAQMAAAAGMAINAPAAFRATATGFALSYAAFRYILVAQYARASRFVPEARPITSRFARGFALAATFWAVSVLVAPPLRFILWGVGMVTDFATPISAGRLHARLAPHPVHLPERFGVFTLIVLGESIVAVVAGLEVVHLDRAGAAIALCGLVLAFSFWWVYFESLDASAIRAAREAGKIGVYQLWLYAHLPLAAALAAAGVGVWLAIVADPRFALPPAERSLVCGAVGLCFASLGAIQFARAAAGSRRCTRTEAAALWAGALATLLIGLLGARLTPLGVLALLAGVGALLIVRDLAARSRRS